MTPAHEHNYIQNYETGLVALNADPENRALQHSVVLSLARAGALDLAISEYARFGLAEVDDDEDIMALNARLSKDEYLRALTAARQAFARDAMEKYDAAFQKTGGYYSGINGATMAVMAELPREYVLERVAAIESLLPDPENLTPRDHYFIQATRAECALLKGDTVFASIYLRGALAFDPLNYAAHATTLKQFEMILEKRGASQGWLAPFRPPRPVHYAGRIRLGLTLSQEVELKIQIVDTIQRNDVGAGYGALAAGSDILFAEALLTEGAALHVILPCDKDRFVEHSVRPFGDDWVERFENCLTAASSLRILTHDGPWPDELMNRICAQVAMGQSILWGQSMRVSPAQLLIRDTENTTSYTATHALDWAHTGFPQVALSISNSDPETNTSHQISPSDSQPHLYRLRRSGQDVTESFEIASDAVQSAIALRLKYPNEKVALDIHLSHENEDHLLQSILDHGAPQSLLASENFASLLAYSEGDRFNITYAGRIDDNDGQSFRCYAIESTAASDNRAS